MNFKLLIITTFALLNSSCAQLNLEDKINNFLSGKNTDSRQAWIDFEKASVSYITSPDEDKEFLISAKANAEIFYKKGSCYNLDGKEVEESACADSKVFLERLPELREQFALFTNIQKLDSTTNKNIKFCTDLFYFEEDTDTFDVKKIETNRDKKFSIKDLKFCQNLLLKRDVSRTTFKDSLVSKYSENFIASYNFKTDIQNSLRQSKQTLMEEKSLRRIEENGDLESYNKKMADQASYSSVEKENHNECNLLRNQEEKDQFQFLSISSKMNQRLGEGYIVTENEGKKYLKETEEASLVFAKRKNSLIDKMKSRHCYGY